MKIEHIKIANQWYDVFWEYHFKETNNLGQCDFVLKEIRICPVDQSGNACPSTALDQTFWHEIAEGINHEYFDEVLDHKQIWILGLALMQVLVDNFSIRLYHKEKENESVG